MVSKIETLLLSLLIFLIPSQLAFHLWPSWSDMSGTKIDYLSPTLYLSDVLILILGRNIKIKFTNHLFLFILFSITNILFSTNPPLSVFRYGHLFIYFIFFSYMKQNSHIFISLFKKLFPLVVSLYSSIGIAQFVLQRHLGGLLYFLGERPLTFYLANIAKIHLPLLGLTIRSYSTFPHPNALAGFLLISLMLFGVFKTKLRFYFLPALALITTFSRSAFVALIFSGLFKFWSLLLLPLFIFGSPESFSGRFVLIQNSILIFLKHPLFGIGLGNYSFLSNLNFQPVHNIFLLLISELGILFCIFILCLLIKFLKSHVTSAYIPMLLPVIITGSIDHYWITSHQNFLLLIILLFLIKFYKNEQLS